MSKPVADRSRLPFGATRSVLSGDFTGSKDIARKKLFKQQREYRENRMRSPKSAQTSSGLSALCVYPGEDLPGQPEAGLRLDVVKNHIWTARLEWLGQPPAGKRCRGELRQRFCSARQPWRNITTTSSGTISLLPSGSSHLPVPSAYKIPLQRAEQARQRVHVLHSDLPCCSQLSPPVVMLATALSPLSSFSRQCVLAVPCVPSPTEPPLPAPPAWPLAMKLPQLLNPGFEINYK